MHVQPFICSGNVRHCPSTLVPLNAAPPKAPEDLKLTLELPNKVDGRCSSIVQVATSDAASRNGLRYLISTPDNITLYRYLQMAAQNVFDT